MTFQLKVIWNMHLAGHTSLLLCEQRNESLGDIRHMFIYYISDEPVPKGYFVP